MSDGNLFEIQAGMPEDWCAYCWQCFPPTADPTLYYQLTGIVAPFKTRGKNKGLRNWAKGDKSTERTVILPVAEHEQWVKEWEQRTGKCARCMGTGQTIASCGREGTTYRECSKCKGTCKP